MNQFNLIHRGRSYATRHQIKTQLILNKGRSFTTLWKHLSIRIISKRYKQFVFSLLNHLYKWIWIEYFPPRNIHQFWCWKLIRTTFDAFESSINEPHFVQCGFFFQDHSRNDEYVRLLCVQWHECCFLSQHSNDNIRSPLQSIIATIWINYTERSPNSSNAVDQKAQTLTIGENCNYALNYNQMISKFYVPRWFAQIIK